MTSSPTFALSKEQGKSMKLPMRSVLFAVFLVSLVMPILRAQVLNSRPPRAGAEPHRSTMDPGTLPTQRYKKPSQIFASNVKNLEQKRVFQAEALEKFKAAPVFLNGSMCIARRLSD